MFGKSLSYVLTELGCSVCDYVHLMQVANNASFAPSEIKEAVALALRGHWCDEEDEPIIRKLEQMALILQKIKMK